MVSSSKHACPICGQYNMDFYAITYRNHPFIDGVKYSRMCFGCSHVPKEYIQRYNAKGEIEEDFGPFFDHKHLHTAQELYQYGSVESLAEAQKCVFGVRKRLKEVGAVALKKLKLDQPKHDYDFEEGDVKLEQKRKIKKKRLIRVATEGDDIFVRKKKTLNKKVKFGAKKPPRKSN